MNEKKPVDKTKKDHLFATFCVRLESCNDRFLGSFGQIFALLA